jgi:hypothetical protein
MSRRARTGRRDQQGAFDAELPSCPDDISPGDHWRTHKWLWDKRGLEPLSDNWNEALDRLSETVKAIQRTRADSFFGLGVKLTALPIQHEEEDWQDAVKSALQDINHLLGSEFAENVRADWI